jgi:hypothetical protein
MAQRRAPARHELKNAELGVLQLLTTDPICDVAEARRLALANWFMMPWLFSRLLHRKIDRSVSVSRI